jgi:hypothetical protein
MEEAFWRFVDQRWRDSLNVAAAEPAFTDYNQEVKKGAVESVKKTGQETPRKPHEAEVTVTSSEAAEKTPKKSKFAGVLEFTGTHPP